ncbi:type II secretion system protein GspD [Candidatus Omnitrophota bacterium]
MKIKKSNSLMKALSMVIAIFFAYFSISSNCLAQMDISPGPANNGPVTQVAVKEALPQTGNVTVNFKDVDIKTVLHYLSEISGVDIVPSPGVDASITMRLRDKPWEVALDIVTRNYGYVYSSDEERGIIRVMPKSMLRDEEPITEVIPLNHMIREIELAKEEEGEGIVVQARQESILQLMMAVNSILNTKRGERATYISGANAIVVTAIPARITEIKSMIAKIDKKTPQIVLDCKVIEVNLDDDERFGVDWNAVISAAGAMRPTTFPFTNAGILKNLPGSQREWFPKSDTATGGTDFPLIDIAAALTDPLDPAIGDDALFTYGTLDFSTFTATLRLIQDRTDSQVLSSPRITTLNNQKAVIKVVEKIMLQKTQETTQTAGIVTVEFEKESEAREVGVILAVIPHVNEEGDISVNLFPEVSNRVGNGFEVLQIGTTIQNTVALTFNSREANTIVRVRDGETIFIGGLIREDMSERVNKLPILGDLFGDLPGIGGLVKYTEDIIDKTEIVFFVTVHLVKDGMESMVDSQSLPVFNKYVRDRISEDSGKKEKGTPELKQGELENKQERVEVMVEPLKEEEKKAYKPFLDFRKKTEDLGNKT